MAHHQKSSGNHHHQHHIRPTRTIDELQAFLTKLARAITTGDGQAAAQLWEVPAFVIGDDMAMPLTDPEQIATFFGGARAEYNANGITDTQPQILTVDWISDKLCVVKVRWPYLDADGREIGAEASDYTVSRDETGQLRLRVATMRGVEGAKQIDPA